MQLILSEFVPNRIMEVFTIIYATKEVAMETLSWIGILDLRLR